MTAMSETRPATAADAPGKPPLAPIAFATPLIAYEKHADGTVRLRSRWPLEAYDSSLAGMFRAAVRQAPDRVFLAERAGEGWRTVTYAEARLLVDGLAQALLDRGVSAERPVMILSGNSVDHALLMLAGYTAGIPVAPISVAYSLQSQDHAKLKHIAALLQPGMIYVADTAPFARALDALDLGGVEIIASMNGGGRAGVTDFAALAATAAGPAVEQAVAAITPDTIAKFLFTSGSTTLPKGVINTHRMLTANQQQILQVWPFLAEQTLVLLDWLPWNHTFGGNHNFNMVMRNAGTLYIDGGKPAPGLIEQTLRNLRDVSPTIWFNVPAGYAMLLPFLERDDDLARSLFARLRLIFYAGAALPQDLWERLEAVSARVTGLRVPMTSSWGTTETAPMATMAHFPIACAGPIGVPPPGIDVKLVPNAAKLEIRVRGPNVTPGYWKRDDLNAEAFDEEGFYKPGDAVRFIAPADPAQGVAFDGRLTEDFKLDTGTWVHVGALRIDIIAAASPVLQDAAITGENRAYVGLLAWLNAGGCRGLLGAGAPEDLASLAAHAAIREHVRAAVARWNAGHGGSSQHIRRVLLLPDPPSVDANEITDKGYINQRLALERRKAAVERLYAAEPDDAVIVIG
jgi:feruloyl-CoA synthase